MAEVVDPSPDPLADPLPDPLPELHAASADDMSTLLDALQDLAGERADDPLAVGSG